MGGRGVAVVGALRFGRVRPKPLPFTVGIVEQKVDKMNDHYNSGINTRG